MSLQEKIELDFTNALKSKKDTELSTLRLLKAAIKNSSIAKGQDLTDEDVLSIIQKEIKQRRDSIEQYKKATRLDLANKETEELQILEKYLPPQISDEELESIIQTVIDQTKANTLQDMGKVMAEVMPKVKGRADGSKISILVKEALSHE